MIGSQDSRPAIRLARPDDLPRIVAIERAALKLFEGHIAHDVYVASDVDLADYERGVSERSLWVAEISPHGVLGAVLVSDHAGEAYLQEIDVHPDFGRRGIGTLLLGHACDQTKARGHTAITLATLSDVPWNAPFYARHGFDVIPESEWTPFLRELREQEARKGFPMHLRVFMRRTL